MNKEARILYLVKGEMIGGAERIILDLTTHFKDNSGVTVSVSYSSLFGELIESEGCKHYLLQNKNYFSISNYRLLRKIIVENEINIIHTVHRTFLLVIWLLKTRLNIISIYSAVNVFNDWKNHLFKTDAFTALSTAVYENLVNKYRIDANKISLIHHGVPIEAMIVKKESVTKVKGKITLGYAGRFEPEKGINILLEAYAQVDNKKFSLFIKGDGSIKKEIILHSNQLGLSKKIVFEDWENDLNSFWENVDVLILPSVKAEGLGIILLEALAHGKIIISSRVGGITDIIVDGWNGYLVQASSIEELKIAINKLYNKEEWPKLIENGYKTLEKFNLRNVLKEYEQLYAKLLRNYVAY